MADTEKFQKLLQHRMLLATTSSALAQILICCFSHFLSNINLIHPTSWIGGTLSTILQFRTFVSFVFFAFITFGQGYVTSQCYQKQAVYFKSRFAKFCRAFDLGNLSTWTSYILAGGFVAWIRITSGNGPFNNMFQPCPLNSKHLCIVEEYVYLLLFGFWIGLYFVATSDLLNFRYLDFPIIPLSKFSQVRREILNLIFGDMWRALWPSIYFMGIYYFFGSYAQCAVSAVFGMPFVQEPLNSVARFLELKVFFQSWIFAAFFISSSNVMLLLFRAYLTEWTPFEIDQRLACDSREIALMEVLSTEKIPIVQNLGFLDLATFAQKDKQRRSSVFTLSQPGGHPYNWNCVVKKCLETIKEFTMKMNEATTLKKEQKKKQETTSLAVPTKPVFVNVKNMAVSPIAILKKEELVEQSYLGNLKRNIMGNLLAKPLIFYFFGEQLENKLMYIFTNGSNVVWAADAISSLAAVSIEEDRYGIVQKDLPTILDHLLEAKGSLDQLQRVNFHLRKPLSEDKFVQQMQSRLQTAFKKSIYRIVYTFGDYIHDLGLTPKAIDQLQPYFTFRE